MPTGKPTHEKRCIICNELFLPEKPSSKICKRTHYNRCPICNKQMVWNSTRSVEPCCKECRKEATRRKNVEKYGCDHPMQNKEVQNNHKKAMLSKYGVESPLQSEEIKSKAIATNQKKFGSDWALGSKQIIAKSKQTMMSRYGGPTTMESPILKEKALNTFRKKYGVDNPSKVEKFRQQAKDTNIIRYGVDNPMSNTDICMSAIKTRIEHYGEFWPPEIDEKAKQTFLERYGVDNPSKSDKIMDAIKNTCMSRYGVPYGCMIPDKQNNFHKISKPNLLLHDRLERIGIRSSFEFYLCNKFYDLILPDQNILVEINPTYTHNIIGNHWNKEGLDKNYHLEKTQIAAEHGYRCIHIFDWDDLDKVVDMLKPKKSVYARKCEIYKLIPQAGDEFLKKYHLQGTCRGQLLYLGLVYQNELLQVMTFGKSRYDKNHDVELLRLCTKLGYTVIGGASRLFSYATNEFGLNNIISYCDRSKFTGAVYEKLGMRLIRTSPPQEVWSQDNRRVTANLLRSRGYDQLFKTNYGKGVSNEQLMLENGWLPVYDCGQYVYEYK